MQKWITVDEKYLDDLRVNVDSRVPKTDYGADRLKPFFGELFEIEGLVYVTQISHAQPRHHKMKQSLDFYKIYIPSITKQNEDYLAAVVNLNYMIPVPRTLITNMNYNEIGVHRTFKTEMDKSKYIDLLKNELQAIQKLNIEVRARRLYDLKREFPTNRISSRCLDFSKLEEYSKFHYL